MNQQKTQFRGSGQPFRREDVERACVLLGVAQPELWAVLAVETRGFGFLPDRRPQILFERHVFRQLTGGRFDAVRPSISHSEPGGYEGGAREYSRLAAALVLDREAALRSASWGLGQIMGFNFRLAGFATLDEMVAAMVESESRQLEGLARCIVNAGLDGALRRRDWAAFARGYNGTDYKRNQYDARLADAFVKFAAARPDLRLRTAQAALLYLGIDPGPVDGLRGKRTSLAISQYQSSRRIKPTGDLDPQTESRLLREAFPQR